jgi:uncharacterized protein YkwD
MAGYLNSLLSLGIIATASSAFASPASLVFHPPGSAASDFSTTTGPTSPGQQELIAAVAERWPDLGYSSRIARAAEAYALATKELSINELPPSLLEHLLSWAGYPVPTSIVSVISTSEDGLADLLAHIGEVLDRSDAPLTELGIGRVPSTTHPYHWRWAVIFVRRLVNLEPFPAQLEPAQTALLRFQLAPGMDRAKVVVLYPDQELVSISPIPVRGGLPIRASNLSGELRLQIVASSSHGEVIVAQMSVAVGRQRNLLWQGTPIPDESHLTSARDAEALMHELVNQERDRHGLFLLNHDPNLAEIARAHSLDMTENRFFSHDSPSHGGLEQRVRAFRYHSHKTRENIALSSTIHSGMASLMTSPGHRANILATDIENLGVGITESQTPSGSRTWMATQVFARPAVTHPISEVRELAMKELRRLRLEADLEPLQPNQILNYWAHRLTSKVLTTGELDRELVTEAILQLDPEQLLAITTHVEMVSVTDLSDIRFTSKDASHLLMRWVGVGVACTETVNGPPVYTVVVLLAGAIPPPPAAVQ